MESRNRYAQGPAHTPTLCYIYNSFYTFDALYVFPCDDGGTFAFFKFLSFEAGNFYRFKNEGYLLELFKMRFFLTELCLYMRSPQDSILARR